MSGRVLVVGFDGATFDIIHPLVEKGRLPNLARIIQNGAWGELQSTIPPVTPSAWTSFFTGKNPGKHGIFDFQSIDFETYEFKTNKTHKHREKSIWELLNEIDLRTIIMDVPFTYPPKPINGLMLTGYGTPRTESTQFTYPEEFAQHLPPELHSEIRVALPKNKFDRSQAFIDEWTEVMRGRSKMLTHLIQAGKWDLFMVVFSITDNMAHVFWTYVDPEHPNYYKPEAGMYREAFYHSYEMCDAILGELMSRAGDDTTTLILSDHGFGSVRPRQYIFKRYFEGKFLFPKQSSSRFGVINEFLAKTAVNTYTKFPFLREWIKGMSPGQREGVRQALNKAGYIPSLNASDLTRSKIIPANLGSRIWINEIGRFSQGIVPSSEKESLMQELQDFLLSDIDPITNQQIVSDVFRGKDLYQGEFSHMAPDLIIEYTNSYKPVNETEIRNPHTEGGHTLDGVFLAYGPNIQKTAVSDASLIDLAPTILHLFNQPIPPDMDGQVLTTIFTKEYQVKHPIILGEKPARKDTIQENTEFSATEEAELNDQLRQLGYIE